MKIKLLLFFTIAMFTQIFFSSSGHATEILNEYGIKNNVISTSQLTNSNWIEFPNKVDVPLNKSWTVTFSSEVTYDKIDGAVIEQNSRFIPVEIDIISTNQLKITPVNPYEAKGIYTLKVFLNNGLKYKMAFQTSSDYDSLIDPINLNSSNEQIIRVPAMPSKGFNFPYYIRIPSTNFKHSYNNDSEKRYIFLDTANSGPTNLSGTEYWVKNTLSRQSQVSVQLAEQMWAPIIMPATPRSNVCYGSRTASDYNCFYEHALDRDSVIMNQLLNGIYKEEIVRNFQSNDLNAYDYQNYDKQIIAMFEHAAAYLNAYGQNVQTDKMIVTGYSAGGTFSDRLAMLHPNRIKAVVSGATLDDMVSPVASYKGQNLIFPVGIADYKEITGRSFDINEVNKVAKLVYMGKDDENNTLPYSDTYGEIERQAITNAFGTNILDRAKTMMNIYHDNGGQAMFILDVGIKHSYSREMIQYQLDFLRANRNSDTPVYPIPQNTLQLEYKLH